MSYNKKIIITSFIWIFTIGLCLYGMNTPREVVEETKRPEVLQIYTVEDIYYVFELNITSEATNMYKTFSSQKELNDFIKEITARDAVKGIECLNSKR